MDTVLWELQDSLEDSMRDRSDAHVDDPSTSEQGTQPTLDTTTESIRVSPVSATRAARRCFMAKSIFSTTLECAHPGSLRLSMNWIAIYFLKLRFDVQ